MKSPLKKILGLFYRKEEDNIENDSRGEGWHRSYSRGGDRRRCIRGVEGDKDAAGGKDDTDAVTGAWAEVGGDKRDNRDGERHTEWCFQKIHDAAEAGQSKATFWMELCGKQLVQSFKLGSVWHWDFQMI